MSYVYGVSESPLEGIAVSVLRQLGPVMAGTTADVRVGQRQLLGTMRVSSPSRTGLCKGEVTGVWGLVRQRKVWLLWIGCVASHLGDWALIVGLPLVVYKTTGSILATSWVAVKPVLMEWLVPHAPARVNDAWPHSGQGTQFRNPARALRNLATTQFLGR